MVVWLIPVSKGQKPEGHRFKTSLGYKVRKKNWLVNLYKAMEIYSMLIPNSRP